MISTNRILNITNGYAVIAGNSLHIYFSKLGAFRFSILGLISLLLTNTLYFAALWTHYTHQQQIHVLRVLSELLHDCVYLHLLIGVVNWLVVLLQYRSLLDFASQVAERALVLDTIARNHFTAIEWFIYYRMWSNSFVLLCLTVYNLCLIDLRSLTGTKIMLIIGLALPHLMIADILRFVTIQSLLINAMWSESNRNLTLAGLQGNTDDLASNAKNKDFSFK